MQASNTSAHKHLALLFAGITFLLLHHLCFFSGHFGYDDMHYAKLSHNLLNGNIDFNDHFSYRWTILGFTALSYLFSGVNDTASAAPALAMSVAMLVLMYTAFRKLPAYVYFAGLVLFFSIRWNLFYSDKLMPDVYVGFFAFCAWLVYEKQGAKTLQDSLLFASGLFLAFLSKGTSILLLPLLAYYFAKDAWLGKNKRFWLGSTLFGAALLAGYFALIYLLTGNPWSRFAAIDANAYFNSCSYNRLPMSATLERLAIGFPKLAWNELLVVFLAVALLPKLPFKKLKVADNRSARATFYSNTIIVLFLSMNFMTISLKSYNPTCLDIRHYLFSVPIMSVCAAKLLFAYDWFSTRKMKIALLCLSVPLLHPSIKQMLYARTVKYEEVRQDMLALGKSVAKPEAIILSNQVMVNFINYYSGFRPSCDLVPYTDIKEVKAGNNYLVASGWYTEYFSSTSLEKLRKHLRLAQGQLSKDESMSQKLKTITLYRINGQSQPAKPPNRWQ